MFNFNGSSRTGSLDRNNNYHLANTFKSNFTPKYSSTDKKVLKPCLQNVNQLRNEIPFLANRDIFNSKLAESERILMDLLRSGWHYAFTEVLDLLQTEVIEMKKQTSPTSCTLATSKDILYKLRDVLSVVEAAQRCSDDHQVFMKYKELVDFFEELQFSDKNWVKYRFINYMMAAANRIHDDCGFKQANALQYFCEMKLKIRHYQEAVSAAMEMYELAKSKKWVSLKDSKEMELIACRLLIDTYLAEIDDKDMEEAAYRLSLARKAIKVGLLSKNYLLQGYVNSKVNELIEKFASLQDALEFNRSFFKMCEEKEDSPRLREICTVLERLYNRAGRSQEAVKYLHKFAQIAENNEDWISLCIAFQLLGMAFDRCGDYKNSLKWNKKAYDMPRLFLHLKEEFARVNPYAAHFFGINRAHSILEDFKINMANGSAESILRIIYWKNLPNREGNVFDSKTLPKALHSMKDFTIRTTFESFFDDYTQID